MKIERRMMQSTLEVRADKVDEKETKTITGKAVPYNELSVDLGGFKERFLPGAFSESIKNQDVRFLYSHDSANLLGRVSNKTLALSEKDDGLYVDNSPPDTQLGRDTVVLLERGDLKGLSIGFMFARDEKGNLVGVRLVEENGEQVVEVERAELHEVSIVGNPAYPSTSAQLRHYSLDDLTKREEAPNPDSPTEKKTPTRRVVASQRQLEIE